MNEPFLWVMIVSILIAVGIFIGRALPHTNRPKHVHAYQPTLMIGPLDRLTLWCPCGDVIEVIPVRVGIHDKPSQVSIEGNTWHIPNLKAQL